jgi:hypothetical protein
MNFDIANFMHFGTQNITVRVVLFIIHPEQGYLGQYSD